MDKSYQQTFVLPNVGNDEADLQNKKRTSKTNISR